MKKRQTWERNCMVSPAFQMLGCEVSGSAWAVAFLGSGLGHPFLLPRTEQRGMSAAQASGCLGAAGPLVRP